MHIQTQTQTQHRCWPARRSGFFGSLWRCVCVCVYVHVHIYVYDNIYQYIYIHVVCTYQHAHGIYRKISCMYMYLLCISYVQIKYLYSTACLYNRSSEGVNLFCCSSSIVGRKPPSNAAECDILLPVLATGTGSLLSNECSLSKPACSWLSKPLINLLMASSVSAASGLA